MKRILNIVNSAGAYLTFGGLLCFFVGILWSLAPAGASIFRAASEGNLMAIGVVLLLAAGVVAVLHTVLAATFKKKAS